jgi:hypothetical protein
LGGIIIRGLYFEFVEEAVSDQQSANSLWVHDNERVVLFVLSKKCGSVGVLSVEVGRSPNLCWRRK